MTGLHEWGIRCQRIPRLYPSLEPRRQLQVGNTQLSTRNQEPAPASVGLTDLVANLYWLSLTVHRFFPVRQI